MQRGSQSTRYGAEQLFVHAVLLVAVLLAALPLISLFYEAFTTPEGAPTFMKFWETVSDSYNLESIENSLILSLVVALFSVLFGTLFAFGLTRTDMPLKRLLRATVTLSIISPGFLVAFAYVVLMGPNSGVLNEFVRALFGLTARTGPFDIYSGMGFVLLGTPMGIGICVLQLAPALANVDSSVEEASRISGAGPLSTLLAITFRLIQPALLSAFVLIFILSLSFYGIPQILGLNVVSVAIRQSLLVVNDLRAAAVLAVVVTLISLVAVAIHRSASTAQKRYYTIGNKGARNDTFRIGRWRYAFVLLTGLYSAIALVLPYATLLYMSFLNRITGGLTRDNLTIHHYAGLISDDFTRLAIFNSLLLAVASGLVVVVFGLACGYVLARIRTRTALMLDYIAMLPLGLAGTAFGVAILITYLSPALRFLALPGTLTIMGLAYVAHFMSFGVRSAETGLLQISPELDEAARIGGASRLGAFLDVDLPLLKEAILSTSILVIVLCFPELSISIMLESVDTQVVATALLARWQGAGGLQSAAAMAVLLFGVTAIVLSILYTLLSKKGKRIDF